MILKIKAILGSIRFWQVVIATTLFGLTQSSVITNDVAVLIANVIAGVFGFSVAIGTIDKFGTK